MSIGEVTKRIDDYANVTAVILLCDVRVGIVPAARASRFSFLTYIALELLNKSFSLRPPLKFL